MFPAHDTKTDIKYRTLTHTHTEKHIYIDINICTNVERIVVINPHTDEPPIPQYLIFI